MSMFNAFGSKTDKFLCHIDQQNYAGSVIAFSHAKILNWANSNIAAF